MMDMHALLPSLPLAQSQRGMGSVFFWLLVLIGLVIVAAVLVLYLRKWYSSPDVTPSAGFTLGDIRQLHREGQMTDEEFEKAKALILGQTRRQLHEPDPNSKNATGLRDVKLEE
jgi:ABC-type iron transport system FetAB permease component